MKFKATYRVPGVNSPKQVKLIEASDKLEAFLTFSDYVFQTKGVAMNTQNVTLKPLGFSVEDIQKLRESGLDDSNIGVVVEALTEYKIKLMETSKVL
jgi:hypothetical protein